jgi:hypothetical protein
MSTVILLLVGLALLAPIAYMVYRKMQREAREFARHDPFPDEGKGLVFSGEGEFTSPVVRLEAGDYKLLYWFDEAVPVKVELTGLDTGDNEVLLIKSGEGAISFGLVAPGRYRFAVEPSDAESEWDIEISPLGLPSRRAQPPAPEPEDYPPDSFQ